MPSVVLMYLNLWKNSEKELQKILKKIFIKNIANKQNSIKVNHKRSFSPQELPSNESRHPIAEQVDLQDGDAIASIVRIKISRYDATDYDAELADGVSQGKNFCSSRVRAGILKELH